MKIALWKTSPSASQHPRFRASLRGSPGLSKTRSRSFACCLAPLQPFGKWCACGLPPTFGDFVSLVLHYVATSPKFGERRPNVGGSGKKVVRWGARHEDAGPDGGAHPSQALPKLSEPGRRPSANAKAVPQALQGFGLALQRAENVLAFQNVFEIVLS